MAGHRTRRASAAAALAAVLGVVLAGCTDSPSETARRAESAVESVASQASEALESATAEADRRLDDIKGGVDAKDQVRLGAPTVTDGRASVEVTARNTADSAKSFAVQVEFTDRDGNLLDTVVVTLDDVPPGRSAEATARGTHDLSGDIRAELGRALRY
ncbi:FxLYD domain-containing protein [Streptomyces bullii]|uniref:FxLYD domain-containing protein n=1 Tax=Streptomyces bullii TaxID=349910 RepID=A0ABW0UKH4_9ACTN